MNDNNVVVVYWPESINLDDELTLVINESPLSRARTKSGKFFLDLTIGKRVKIDRNFRF